MEVRIPFRPYFKEPLLNDIKVFTARPYPMGAKGDTFTAFGAQFEIDYVKLVNLEEVSELWKEEGCTSIEHFIEIWNNIHPKSGYNPKKRVYLHHFRRVSNELPESMASR